jgi:RNA polymerase sigma-70 factor (ECF subfamily)
MEGATLGIGQRLRPASSGTRSERALIRAAKKGSPEALEELARAHWPTAYRLARGITADSHAAQDVAQEALMAAIRNLDRFDRRRPLAPWLDRIVTNRALDWVRARGRRDETQLPEALQSVDEPRETALSDELSVALSSLGPTERAVVVLRHALGYSSEEIARMLDLRPGTVRSHLHRALTRLRERVTSPPRSAEEVRGNE